MYDIKSKGNYQPENLMSNGSSRHDDAAYIYIYICKTQIDVQSLINVQFSNIWLFDVQ